MLHGEQQHLLITSSEVKDPILTAASVSKNQDARLKFYERRNFIESETCMNIHDSCDYVWQSVPQAGLVLNRTS